VSSANIFYSASIYLTHAEGLDKFRFRCLFGLMGGCGSRTGCVGVDDRPITVLGARHQLRTLGVFVDPGANAGHDLATSMLFDQGAGELLRSLVSEWIYSAADLVAMEVRARRMGASHRQIQGERGKLVDMIPVSSSAIAAVGYDPSSMRMKIRFVAGGTYDFCRVPGHVFQGLLAAASKGKYYDTYIRGQYQC
jgi:hypothetical protein